jgi:prepilin-type N-terminal cleavage/methylation domain-containing protein/prepilin-type processing-associated H-X9-DG protein
MNHSKFRSSNPGIRQGFTLTELLVVMLIISILAILAFLGTNRLRAIANKANAIRNLSQLQTANATYATDHNDKCVPIRANDENGNPTRWFQDVKYLANLTGKSVEELERNSATAIPLDMLDPKVVRARKPFYDRVYTSYGMNDTNLQLGGEPDLRSGHNLNQVSDLSQTMAFATATDFRVTYNSRYKWNFKNPKDEKTAAGDLAYRHGDKILVVYFDGHVGEMSKVGLEEIDKRGGKNNAFWKP